MGRAVQFTKGLTRNEMMKEARKQFPGVHGTKEKTPEIAQILSMQSMIPPVYDPKRPRDAPPLGPQKVRRIDINARTSTDSLLKAFLPKMEYSTPYPPYLQKQRDAAEAAMHSPVSFFFQLNSMKAGDLEIIRSNLKGLGLELAFVRPSILKAACEKTVHLKDKAPLCKGYMMIAYWRCNQETNSTVDMRNLRQAVQMFDGTQQRLLLLFGCFEESVKSANQLRLLINQLPDRQDMYRSMISYIESPAVSISSILMSTIESLVYCLEERIKSLQ